MAILTARRATLVAVLVVVFPARRCCRRHLLHEGTVAIVFVRPHLWSSSLRRSLRGWGGGAIAAVVATRRGDGAAAVAHAGACLLC